MIIELTKKCSQVADVFPFLTEAEVVQTAIQLLQVEQLKRLNDQILEGKESGTKEWMNALGVIYNETA